MNDEAKAKKQAQQIVKMLREAYGRTLGFQKLLDILIKEWARADGKGFLRVERYMETSLANNMKLKPLMLSELCINNMGIPAIRKKLLMRMAQKVKNRLVQEGRRALKRKGLPIVPCSEMVFDTKKRRKRTLPKEQIADAETAAAPTTAITETAAEAKTYTDYNKYIEPTHTHEDFMELINPYMAHIKKMGFEEILETCLFRITEYGNRPSLLPRTAEDLEARELSSYRKYHGVFRRLALADHIYLVLKHALAEMNARMPKGVNSYSPWLIPMCLTMDLGNVDSFRTDIAGNKTDHTVISADLFKDLVKDKVPAEFKLEPMLEAIRNHHVPPVHDEDALSEILRNATVKARQEEAATALNLKIVDFDKWFNPKIIIDAFKPNLNQCPKLGVFEAFYREGIVWTHPNAIFTAVRKYAEKNGIVDMRLYVTPERSQMMAIIYDAIRKAGYLDDSIKPNYLGDHYYINFKGFKDKNRKSISSMFKFMTPMKSEPFGELSPYLKYNQSGWLKMIHSIKRAKKLLRNDK